MSDSKKPAARVKLHPVSAAIWRNENEKGAFYSVTFERSYKDEAGKWKASSSFYLGDLLLVAEVADLARTELAKMYASDRRSDHPEVEVA